MNTNNSDSKQIVTIKQLLGRCWNTHLKSFEELTMTSLEQLLHDIGIHVTHNSGAEINSIEFDLPIKVSEWELKDNEIWITFTHFGMSNTSISSKSIEDFRGYLESREYDIAMDIEDFGSLAGIFEELFGRRPNSNGV